MIRMFIYHRLPQGKDPIVLLSIALLRMLTHPRRGFLQIYFPTAEGSGERQEPTRFLIVGHSILAITTHQKQEVLVRQALGRVALVPHLRRPRRLSRVAQAPFLPRPADRLLVRLRQAQAREALLAVLVLQLAVVLPACRRVLPLRVARRVFQVHHPAVHQDRVVLVVQDRVNLLRAVLILSILPT